MCVRAAKSSDQSSCANNLSGNYVGLYTHFSHKHE